jgi:hypothetical protein
VYLGNKHVRIQALLGAEGLVTIWAYKFSLGLIFFVPFFHGTLMLGLVMSPEKGVEELFEVSHLVLRFWNGALCRHIPYVKNLYIKLLYHNIG